MWMEKVDQFQFDEFELRFQNYRDIETEDVNVGLTIDKN